MRHPASGDNLSGMRHNKRKQKSKNAGGGGGDDTAISHSILQQAERADILPFVILHESVEKSIVDELGLIYQHAHQLAQRLEQAAIRDAGISWRKYDAFIQAHLKNAEERPDLRIPPDLDLKPYRDEEDYPMLRRMRRDASRRPRAKSSKRSKKSK
jgi:hypothetical protein